MSEYMQLREFFQEVIRKCRADKTKLSPLGKTTKLGEEMGELCTEVLINEGEISPKTDRKPSSVLEEAADVILMTLDIIGDQYDQFPEETIVEYLCQELRRKMNKWEEKITL